MLVSTTASTTTLSLILLCYFGQLTPWILVPRGTYIYHYFPCVPFLILAIVVCLDLLADAGVKAAATSGDAEQKQKYVERGVLILLIVLYINQDVNIFHHFDLFLQGDNHFLIMINLK